MDRIRPVTSCELLDLIKCANTKTCSLDPCPTDLLKKTFGIHIETLLSIFNTSFDEGVFPDIFKTAQVTPLLKSPSMDKFLLKSYRPVSNLRSVGKLHERVGVIRLNEHIENSHKLEVCQSAYKPGHSTETALLKVFSDIATHMDQGRIVLLAMIDLSAAFDTIDHDMLVRLMDEEYGIRGSALSWYSSYFRDRHQYCKLGCHESDRHKLNTGCPQGSVFGPVSYNLYTAPIERILARHGLQYHKYADDIQVYISCRPEDFDSAKSSLEKCLAEIRCWMLRWRLKINDSKTEFIVFRNQKTKIPDNMTIQLGSSVIKSSETVKNLGTFFESSLSSTPHVSGVVKTCNYHLRQLGRIRQYITKDACKRAVHALVIGRLDYCNSLLMNAPASLMDKLQRVQNRAARLVLLPRGRPGIVRATPLLKQLSWLPVKLRVIFKVCVIAFKCVHGSAPAYLKDLLQKQTRDSRLRQPQHNELQQHVARRKVGASSLQVAGPVLWNRLPPELRNTDKLYTFRRQLKTHLWTNYNI